MGYNRILFLRVYPIVREKTRKVHKFWVRPIGCYLLSFALVLGSFLPCVSLLTVQTVLHFLAICPSAICIRNSWTADIFRIRYPINNLHTFSHSLLRSRAVRIDWIFESKLQWTMQTKRKFWQKHETLRIRHCWGTAQSHDVLQFTKFERFVSLLWRQAKASARSTRQSHLNANGGPMRMRIFDATFTWCRPTVNAIFDATENFISPTVDSY